MHRIALLGVALLGAALGCSGNGNPVASAEKAQAAVTTTGSVTTPTAPPAGARRPGTLPDIVRPDTFNGTPVADVALQAGRQFGWPSVKGTTFRVTFDTLPSGKKVDVVFLETRSPGGTVFGTLFSRTVTTPFAMDVVASRDSYMTLSVGDPAGGGLVLHDLRVKPTRQGDASSFGVSFHIAGDSFAGFGKFNDLATDADVQAFLGDLVKRFNDFYAQAGIRIDLSRSSFDRISNAAVVAADPGLVENGVTVLEGTKAEPDAWGTLGVPASDATFGKSLDIFIVHDGSPDDDTTGICECYLPMGGVFSGNGAGTFIVVPLFPVGTTPRTMDQLGRTLAHETGHFLGLLHTTELDFASADDIIDTPVVQPGEDPRSDATNLMCPTALLTRNSFTLDQINAMKGYLAIRDH